MSLTDELVNFTSSMNVQGKYQDPHAKTDFQKEIDKLDLAFKKGELTQEDYTIKRSGLMRMQARPKI